MKCNGECEPHKGEVERVTVTWNGKPLEFNYCQEAIKEDCRRGFKVFDKDGNLFQYIPEQLNKISANTITNEFDLTEEDCYTGITYPNG